MRVKLESFCAQRPIFSNLGYIENICMCVLEAERGNEVHLLARVPFVVLVYLIS